jgi:hypothetical protein
MPWLYHESYPTRDGAIPWRLFVLFTRALPRLATREQLERSYAVAHGYTSARIQKKDRFVFDAETDIMRRFADATPDGEH